MWALETPGITPLLTSNRGTSIGIAWQILGEEDRSVELFNA